MMLRNEEKALDASQEVFVKLLRHRSKLRGEYPSSLLYTIATNTCLNIIRGEKRRPAETGSEAVLDRIASYDDSHERLAVADFLDFVFRGEKPSTRAMAVMHYVDGMTLEQTAQESGMSVSGVRKRLEKLRRRAGTLEGGRS